MLTNSIYLMVLQALYRDISLKFLFFIDRSGERIVRIKRHANEPLGFKFKGGNINIKFYLVTVGHIFSSFNKNKLLLPLRLSSHVQDEYVAVLPLQDDKIFQYL